MGERVVVPFNILRRDRREKEREKEKLFHVEKKPVDMRWNEENEEDERINIMLR